MLAGRACHPKSLVRPLAVSFMNVHFMAEAAPGFQEAPKAIDPSIAYIRHLRWGPGFLSGRYPSNTQPAAASMARLPPGEYAGLQLGGRTCACESKGVV